MPNVTSMNGLFDAEFFDVESNAVGATFRIFVGKPPAMNKDTAYPVIYALDGNASFASLLGSQRMLAQGGEVPTALVVGIGYPGNTMSEAMANRNRDYTPSDPGETEVRALGAWTASGGAAFLRFLKEELKPMIEDQYPVDQKQTTLQGISLGGLFGAWTLLTAPETFANYILGSPALWWRNEEWRQWEETYAKNNDDLHARVFVGAGELEVDAVLKRDAARIAEKVPAMRDHVQGMIDWHDEHGWPEIAKLTPQFAHQLESRNYPGLAITCHNFPDENHMSAPPAITSRGLRYVFGSWQP